MPDLRVFENVELVTVGTHPASTGETEVTREDLEAILAAHSDLRFAPVKLGHQSTLNEGQPAYGQVTPTEIVHRNGRDVLLGRLSGIPARLAEVMKHAFPDRSVEIGWGVKGLSGKAHRAALVGLALLGVTPPAVKDLSPIDQALALYSSDGIDAQGFSVVSLSSYAPTVHNDADHEGDTVPDDLNARLQQMSDDDLRAALGARLGTLNPTAPATAPVSTPAVAENQPTEPATTAAPVEPASAPAAPSVPVEPVAPGVPGVVPPAQDAAPQLVGALSADAPVVQLSRAQYDAMSAAAAHGVRVETESYLDGLVRAGQIAPAERAWAAQQLAEHGAAARSMLSGLQARFPVSELGADHAPTSAQGDPAWDAYVNRPAFG
jgi:hypothetical protein